jgi:predicted ABC-type transport system involved in lysophospholipase L1 biosynthesis ATPase subunit
MTPRLQARSIKRSFQVGGSRIEVLRGIDLEISAGETVFLCGASGAGKTTLLYTLAGLETPESGEVLFEDTSLYALSGNALARLRNQRMGFVFQSYFLLPELTALENVLVPAMIRGQDAKQRALDLLDRVGLADRAAHLPAELSGGEQQRVAIARSLINDPAILFADEPTGNLDSKNGAVIITLLLDLARMDKRSLVVVTHDDHLAQSGDRLVRIEDGLIAA